ncbi:MAG: NUDIX domain-containing protein [Nanoarchaeota archaeon]
MVSIILVDDNKRILLQHRTKDAEKYPDTWGFFGGGIEGNETPKECIVRECFEELEYRLKNPKLILRKEIAGKKFFLFIEKYNPSQKLILKEGQDMKWFKIDEASKINATQFVKEIVKEISPLLNSQT